METNFNWSIIPVYSLDVAKLKAPYDISVFMKKKEISKYLYQIMYKGIVLKYGMSADNSRTYGERIYRQIGHSRSWGEQRLTGSSGSEWRIIEEDFQNQYGVDIHKDFLKIKLWNVSKYPFKTINPWFEVRAMEAVLIDRYRDAVGEKPIGNINDEKNSFKRPAILKSTWETFF